MPVSETAFYIILLALLGLTMIILGSVLAFVSNNHGVAWAILGSGLAIVWITVGVIRKRVKD